MNLKEISNSGLNNTLRPIVMQGSQLFMDELKVLAESAADRFMVQVMTFEGDRAGKMLIDLMIKSPARTKLLVVDYYSDAVINDTLVHFPPGSLDKNVQREFKATQELLKFAQNNGIRVARTNPIGTFYTRYPLRNHKKSIVIDNSLFVGGINFSDHNFAWLDMMIRIDSPYFSSIVANDIHQNSQGTSTTGIFKSEETSLVFLNRFSEKEYAEVFQWMKNAKSSITVFSPYISDPFLSVLKSVSDKIKIRLIVPEQNNKGLFTEYLKRESHSDWFQYYETPGMMSHLKAILIDDKELIFGSSNFDFISYLFEEELVIKTRSEQIVGEFIQFVHDPILNRSVHHQSPSYDRFKSYIPHWLWKLLRVTDPKSNQLYRRP